MDLDPDKVGIGLSTILAVIVAAGTALIVAINELADGQRWATELAAKVGTVVLVAMIISRGVQAAVKAYRNRYSENTIIT